jgi:hypothetical protein
MQKRDNTIGTQRSARKGRHHPKTVLVLRHRPKEREFRKVLPWLAAERPYEPITDASGAVIGAYFLGSNK